MHLLFCVFFLSLIFLPLALLDVFALSSFPKPLILSTCNSPICSSSWRWIGWYLAGMEIKTGFMYQLYSVLNHIYKQVMNLIIRTFTSSTPPRFSQSINQSNLERVFSKSLVQKVCPTSLCRTCFITVTVVVLWFLSLRVEVGGRRHRLDPWIRTFCQRRCARARE